MYEQILSWMFQAKELRGVHKSGLHCNRIIVANNVLNFLPLECNILLQKRERK